MRATSPCETFDIGFRRKSKQRGAYCVLDRKNQEECSGKRVLVNMAVVVCHS